MFKLPIVDFANQNVKVGDVFLFTFTVVYNFLDLPEKVVRYLIEKTKKFEVEDAYMNDQGQLVVQAKVITNTPFLLVFGILVAGTSGLLYIFGITLNKVEKVITVPAGAILSYAVMAITGIIAIKVFFK